MREEKIFPFICLCKKTLDQGPPFILRPIFVSSKIFFFKLTWTWTDLQRDTFCFFLFFITLAWFLVGLKMGVLLYCDLSGDSLKLLLRSSYFNMPSSTACLQSVCLQRGSAVYRYHTVIYKHIIITISNSIQYFVHDSWRYLCIIRQYCNKPSVSLPHSNQ